MEKNEQILNFFSFQLFFWPITLCEIFFLPAAFLNDDKLYEDIIIIISYHAET